MYAAKALKDIEHNVRTLRNSANDRDFAMYQHFREEMRSFMDQWLEIWNTPGQAAAARQLETLRKRIEDDHNDDAATIYGRTGETVGEASTLLNVNREMYNACKSLIAALRELSQVNEHAAIAPDPQPAAGP
jgi:hypothetical protein